MPPNDHQNQINNLAHRIFLHIVTRIQGEGRFNSTSIHRPRDEYDLDTAREAAERAADIALQASGIISAAIAKRLGVTPPAPAPDPAPRELSTEIKWADEAKFPDLKRKPDLEAP